MPRTHRLKIWPAFFEAVADGRKPFELRRDDRGYQVGDWLQLQEWDPEGDDFTGRELSARVSYLTEGAHFGMLPGWVALGLEVEVCSLQPRPAPDAWPWRNRLHLQ